MLKPLSPTGCPKQYYSYSANSCSAQREELRSLHTGGVGQVVASGLRRQAVHDGLAVWLLQRRSLDVLGLQLRPARQLQRSAPVLAVGDGCEPASRSDRLPEADLGLPVICKHPMQPFRIGEDELSLSAVVEVARRRRPVLLSPQAELRITRARAVIDGSWRPVTPRRASMASIRASAFFADVRISAREIAALQRNLIRSHAVGVGPALASEVVRAMLLLRAVTLSRGHSGVRPVIVERLCDFLNRGIHPVVPSRGSVGLPAIWRRSRTWLSR